MNRITADRIDILFNLLIRPIPPFYLQKFSDGLLVETIPEYPGWISSGDGIRRNVSGHHGTSADGRPVSNGNAREKGAPKSDPNVIANDNIASRGGVTLDRTRLLPEKGKGIGADPIGAVLAPEENSDIRPNRTVFTNPQRSSFPPRHHPRFSIGLIADKVSVPQEIFCIDDAGRGKGQFSLDLFRKEVDSVEKVHRSSAVTFKRFFSHQDQ